MASKRVRGEVLLVLALELPDEEETACKSNQCVLSSKESAM